MTGRDLASLLLALPEPDVEVSVNVLLNPLLETRETQDILEVTGGLNDGVACIIVTGHGEYPKDERCTNPRCLECATQLIRKRARIRIEYKDGTAYLDCRSIQSMISKRSSAVTPEEDVLIERVRMLPKVAI